MVLQLLVEANFRATERHLPYGIPQCYLHPTQLIAPSLNPSQIGRYSIYLPRRDGRLGGWLHPEVVYLPTGSHPSQY